MAKVVKTDTEQMPNAVFLPRDRIRPNPAQPREYFEPGALAELAASIKEHGILQPLVVRYEPSRYNATPYIIVAGERRYRASEGILQKLPCIISDVEPGVARVLALAENIHRKDLTAMEEARALVEMMAEQNLSQRAAARALNVSPGWVTNRLALVETGPDVQEVAARVPNALSSLLLVERVKDDQDERQELLEQVEAGAPFSTIKARIDERENHKKLIAATAHAPDRQTEQRAALNQRNGGGNMSRGKLVTGTTPQEAAAAAESALNELERHLRTLESWWPHVPVGKRKQLVQRSRSVRASLEMLDG